MLLGEWVHNRLVDRVSSTELELTSRGRFWAQAASRVQRIFRLTDVG